MDEQTPNSEPVVPQPGAVIPAADAQPAAEPSTGQVSSANSAELPANSPASVVATAQPSPQEPATTNESDQLPDDLIASEPSVPQSLAMDTDDGPVFSWQASEYLHHEKSAGWYLGLGGVLVLLIAAAVVWHLWLSIGVFICMIAALMVYANKAPRTLSYRLDGSGLSIESRHYSYDQFRSYSIVRDIGWHAVDLMPTGRFMPPLTIMFDDADLPQIETLLSAQLPKVDHHPDVIERLSRYLKF